jgi:aconitate hydratase
MPQSVAHKLIASHLVDGDMRPGREIGLRIDQTLTQDATGTLVMLSVEAMGIDRVRTEVSAQYVDHNILQEDSKNPDDHLFLRSACRRFGLWYSRPGNGVSHPVHMERLGVPGKTLLGSDSHTCAAGSLGMLAIGAGGMEVAMAMAGEPFHVTMPAIWGVRLFGALPAWVSAKDVILEMLRRHGVKAGRGRIIEYHGPGLHALSAMDRHVIANMGAELGATTTVFPSDERTREFLELQGRGDAWTEIVADPGAAYEFEDEIDLSSLEPLIARPVSPANVVRVRDIAGEPIHQSYIGSSANPGYRDFAIVAHMVRGQTIPDHVSFDINPTSRQLLARLMRQGLLGDLLQAGARIHQAGCNGCIGMGQAPATGRNSLRTVPRNFPGRSGAREDSVFLCSPETAAASALRGVITDPRDLGMEYPIIEEPPIRSEKEKQPPGAKSGEDDLLTPPLPMDEACHVLLEKGPNIRDIADLEPLPDVLSVPVVLEVGDDVSTDEILPAGARVLPLRSNIEAIAQYCFEMVDPGYVERAERSRERGGHVIIAGDNYGQGSSREHAALAPRHLGLRAVIARSFARIHWHNLINFGVLPLTFTDPAAYEPLEQGDQLALTGLHRLIESGRDIEIEVSGKRPFQARHELSSRQREIVRAGGLINWIRQHRHEATRPDSRPRA